MKVPDNTPEQNDSINDMTAYRKKKKKFKIIKTVVILAVVVALGVCAFIFRDEIIKPFKGIFSGFSSSNVQGGGYPVRLPGSSEYELLAMGDNYALITDTYIYAYNNAGGQSLAEQHGYVDPCGASNDRRVLIYDRGGHDFALYDNDSNIFKLTVDDEVISSAYIGEDGRIAVITSGGRYSNVVYVYDDNGKWLYTRKFIDESVMQADFSDGGKYLYLTVVRSDSGDIVTDTVKYDISTEDGELWKYTISDGIPYALDCSGGAVTIAADNALYSIDPESGKETGRYNYNGELVDVNIGENADILLLDYYTGEGKTLISLDKTCTVNAQLNGYDTIYDTVITGNELCILSGRDIIRLDLKLNELSKARLEEDFSTLIRAGSLYLMMGFDKIEKANL